MLGGEAGVNTDWEQAVFWSFFSTMVDLPLLEQIY
jgi:hypothetical protein